METEKDPIDTSSAISHPISHLMSGSGGPRSAGRRRWLLLLALPFAAGLVATSVARAHGFGGHRGGNGGAFMQERIDHLLTAAGASDAQKTQVRAIWDGLRPQLKEARKQHADLRRQIGEVLTAATIDPAKVEQLRRQSVQALDRVSTLVTQGIVSSAQVLTPEQRRTVLQKIEEHEHRRSFDRE